MNHGAARRSDAGNAAARWTNAGAAWTVAVMALLAAFLLLTRGGALTASFFSDDFLFLDKVRNASPLDLLAPRDLAYHWYRPWSRELHFWAIERAFGANPVPFHVGCLALGLAVLALYFTFVRRLAGTASAAFATAGVAALAAWGVPLEWGPGAQDLWMLALSLAALHAFAWRRTWLALAALALALLSKETAAVVPVVALTFAWSVDRGAPGAELRRAAPLFVLTLAWAALHPALGGRWWWANGFEPLPQAPVQAGGTLARSLLALVNLDLVPAPETGWIASLMSGLPGLAALAALATLAAYAARRETDRRVPRATPASRVAAFGALWFVLGVLPLFAPSVIWQSYYVLFAALGAWLTIAVALRRHPAVLAALVLAVALLRVPRAETLADEWGNEWLMRRGKAFLAETQAFLAGRVPPAPSHARLYFAGVPVRSVFVLGPGDAPALRVWTADSTVRGYYWSQYRARGTGDSVGRDLFFRRDSLGGWREVVKGPESVLPGRPDAGWTADHETLGHLLIEGGDIAAAGIEYAKLADAHPTRAAYAFLAGGCAEIAGDSVAAAAWYERAARLPDADDEMRAKAKELKGF